MPTILTARNLSKRYGAAEIFSALTVHVLSGQRIALVGVNGAGKSTLLRMLAGREEYDDGEIIRARGLRVAYLTQEVDLELKGPILDVARAVFPDLVAMEQQLHALEEAMAEAASAEWTAVSERYAELQTRFDLAGGYEYDRRIRETLAGLGFHEADLERPAESLSGGERTRMALAVTLLRDPDLLLLDEPTNHLDIQAIEWLEHYIQRLQASMVIISHDRRFLDNVATDSWDLDFGSLESYPGNYSRFLQLKAERRARQLAEYEAQQEHIAKEEAFVRRYKAGQRSREARGRLKKLAHIERLDRPREHRSLQIALQAGLRSGEVVFAAEGLAVGLPDRPPLFACPDLTIRRQERVALVGPNGCGKTTFLRTILGELPPRAGDLQIGRSVATGYFAQTHSWMNPEQTILEAIQEVSTILDGRARTLHGRFLFSGDEIYKRLGDLSGGERSRVALARLTLTPANFLLLDEPTNHLDIQAREALEEVLDGYDGTLLLVSHDRALIDALATQVWVIGAGRLTVFPGNWSEYIEFRDRPGLEAPKEETGRPRPERRKAPSPEEKRRRELKARLQELEEEIAAMEEKRHALEAEMTQASDERRIPRLVELAREHEGLLAQLSQRYARWTELAEHFEAPARPAD
jgi:ATP-binding cassette subfamily F protein 3